MDSITIQTQPGADSSKAPEGSTASTNNDGVTTATVSSEKKPEAPSEPKKLAGKYNTPEELEQAYLELQKTLGKPKETPKVPTLEVKPQDAAEKAVEAAGLNIDALSDEFTANGALSDESMAKLTASGVTQEQVTKYIEGQIAVAEKHFNEVASVAGGVEQFAKVLEWAGANASEADQQAYNDAVATKNIGVVKMAVAKLAADYAKANGIAPKLVKDGETLSNNDTGVKPFGSQYEITQAMRDPRYAQDEGYRQSVYARLNVTKMFGA